MKNKLYSDFTAIHKDENGTHILKAKIIDINTFQFQFFNKTNNTLTPVFEVKAGYWELFTQKNSNWTTKDLNRQKLVWCFKVFYFKYLLKKYHA